MRTAVTRRCEARPAGASTAAANLLAIRHVKDDLAPALSTEGGKAMHAERLRGAATP